MDTILQILVIVLLTFLEGVFVAAEIALVTVRRTRSSSSSRRATGRRSGSGASIAQPGRFLAVTQIGLTFLGLPRLGLCRGQPDGQPRAGCFEGTGVADPVARRPAALALIIVTLILSLFTIVFGELVPKSLALAHTERFALRLSGFIEVLLRCARTARLRPDGDHRRPSSRMLGAGDHAQGVMTTAGAVDPGRARRRAGHPRGRGGADDPGGHRARRPAHPRGHGPAHRDGHAARRIDAGGGDRHRRRGGPQPDPGLRGLDRRDRRHPVRQGPAAVPQGVGRRATARSGRCSGRPSSCPSR